MHKLRKPPLAASLDKNIFILCLTKADACGSLYKLNKYRGVEQLVARRAHNPEVVGSSPSPATTKLSDLGLRVFCCSG